MLRRFRETLTLVLLAALPFHALLVTGGTKLFLGPGQAPWTVLTLWKEALLGVLLLCAVIEMLPRWLEALEIDLPDALILVLLVLAVVIPSSNFAIGFKYDFVPLVAFLILRRVTWSDWFRSHVENALLWIGCIIAVYGIVTFFLPQGFFTFLGYSDAHSLYNPGGPLAAFQYISESGIPRIQSTMSGPNQLGIWLLIPLGFVVTRILGAVENGKWKVEKIFSIFNFPLSTFLFVLLGATLALTFSRSAWIAAAVMGCAAIFRVYSHTKLSPWLFGAAGVLVLSVLVAAWLSPAIFIRGISLRGHIDRPLEAIAIIKDHPLGLGLGAAGPASNRISDTCVFLPAGSDPSWARNSPGLCVFVGDEQVQPTGESCACPVLPENWYLQVGVELGVLGLLLYIGLVGFLIRRLGVKNGKWKVESTGGIFQFPFSIFLFFLGICVAALFLHAWEDAAVAYTAWLLAAAVTPRAPRRSGEA